MPDRRYRLRQSPQDGSKDSASSWWPFGSDKVAEQEVKQAVTENVAKADAKSDNASRWWWPFGGEEKQAKGPVVPKVDQKATQAWLDEYEPKLREAIKGSKLELERRDNVLAVTIPVDSSYNPDRPNMLLPMTLGPITRVAKTVEGDAKTAVLVLGHADSSGSLPPTRSSAWSAPLRCRPSSASAACSVTV